MSSNDASLRISVVIPTLQRSPMLEPLVELCARHPLVLEVIVINNAQQPLSFGASGVRVLDQDENIFVNPAWNLGAREAKGGVLALINDDVMFDPEVIDAAIAALEKPLTGIVGVDGAFLNKPRESPIRTRLATYEHITGGFGVFMLMRTADYVPIPPSLRIWGGDDLLFMGQRRPNRVLLGAGIRTDMSVTSSSAEFQAMRQREWHETGRLVSAAPWRWWHGPSRALARMRKMRARALRARQS